MMNTPPDPPDVHATAPTPVKHIGVLLFDDVEELDAVGPWEVLANWTLRFPSDGWAVACISRDGKPVRGAKGLVLGAHHSFSDVPPLEVLIHPGGQGTRPLMRDAEHLAWVREQRHTVPLLTSVCTGALVYAAAGVLAGRPVTTHWQSFGLLSELDPSLHLRPDARFVDDGDVITSAGVSAGIDMALHLVTRLAGPARAREVRSDLQYDARPAAPADLTGSSALANRGDLNTGAHETRRLENPEGLPVRYQPACASRVPRRSVAEGSVLSTAVMDLAPAAVRTW